MVVPSGASKGSVEDPENSRSFLNNSSCWLRLARRLVKAGLTRVDARELRRFRDPYTVYPQIRETVSPESQIVESLSPQLIPSEPGLISRLSFTHLAEIIPLPDENQRRFYEIECIRGNWSVRELRRQIASLYLRAQRTFQKQNPARGHRPRRSRNPRARSDHARSLHLRVPRPLLPRDYGRVRPRRRAA